MFPPPGSAFPGMPPPFGVPPFGAPPFGAAPFGMPPFGMMPFGGPMSFPNFDENKYYYSEVGWKKNLIRNVNDDMWQQQINLSI